jgi:hypothetical protein
MVSAKQVGRPRVLTHRSHRAVRRPSRHGHGRCTPAAATGSTTNAVGVFLVEPLPQLVADVAEIAQQRAGIVQLVGQRYQDGLVRCPGQVADVVFLAFAPCLTS